MFSLSICLLRNKNIFIAKCSKKRNSPTLKRIRMFSVCCYEKEVKIILSSET